MPVYSVYKTVQPVLRKAMKETVAEPLNVNFQSDFLEFDAKPRHPSWPVRGGVGPVPFAFMVG